MSRLERGESYSRGAIAFHWVTAALVLFNLAVGVFHDSLPRDWGMIPIHKAIGIIVLVLTLGRLAWRFAHQPPALPSAMAAWERVSAHAMHWALYAFLIILPMTGWALSSNPEKPRPVSIFGAFQMPVLPVSTETSHAAHEAHELLGWVMLVLVVIHIAAALRHHFLLRDNILARMFPGISQRG